MKKVYYEFPSNLVLNILGTPRTLLKTKDEKKRRNFALEDHIKRVVDSLIKLSAIQFNKDVYLWLSTYLRDKWAKGEDSSLDDLEQAVSAIKDDPESGKPPKIKDHMILFLEKLKPYSYLIDVDGATALEDLFVTSPLNYLYMGINVIIVDLSKARKVVRELLTNIFGDLTQKFLYGKTPDELLFLSIWFAESDSGGIIA